MSQVADRKLADKDVINQGDATQIARAEAKLNNGQIPPNSVSAKAQVKSSFVDALCADVGLLALYVLMWVVDSACRFVAKHLLYALRDVGVVCFVRLLWSVVVTADLLALVCTVYISSKVAFFSL